MSDDKIILVTGGAGYIGSHTCKALSRAGYTPVVFDNLSKGHEHAVKWGPLHKGDIRNKDDVDAAFAEYKPDAVIHFAGLIEVGESVQNPAIYYDNNVTGTLVLLDSMVVHGIKNIVFSSTAAVYGVPENVPIDETAPINPINPYGHTKAAIEAVLRDYGHAYGLNTCALRYFNACGADPDGEIGEEHEPETHLIPRILFAALGDAPEFQMFGDDYPTADGTCVRDYVHVSDLAKGHVLAIERLLNNGEGGAYNLGLGQGYSIKQVLDTVKTITGADFRIVKKDRRPGDPPVLIANVDRAKSDLSFVPEQSDLENIVKTAWNFYKNRHK